MKKYIAQTSKHDGNFNFLKCLVGIGPFIKMTISVFCLFRLIRVVVSGMQSKMKISHNPFRACYVNLYQ